MCEFWYWHHVCVCSELKKHGHVQTCGACLETTLLNKPNETTELACVQTKLTSDGKQTKEDVERVKKQIYQLHAATGHGSTRHMIEALRKRGASDFVLHLAKQFTCHVCQERHKVTHKNAASLEPLPPKWATISADGGKWIHPHTGEHSEFLLVIDEGSQFRTARMMCKGNTRP